MKNYETHERHAVTAAEQRPGKQKILLGEECFQIQGAIFEVYREMGAGFLESVYQECLEREFHRVKIPYESQKELALSYRGDPLLQRFRADFICFNAVILEIKAVREIAPEHKAQILNYLKATGLRVGLLVNFGSHSKATVNRFVV